MYKLVVTQPLEIICLELAQKPSKNCNQHATFIIIYTLINH